MPLSNYNQQHGITAKGESDNLPAKEHRTKALDARALAAYRG